MPIEKAKGGAVGVAGLGLGYYIKKYFKKDEVKRVDVYETNKNVVDMYLSNFREHATQRCCQTYK